MTTSDRPAYGNLAGHPFGVNATWLQTNKPRSPKDRFWGRWNVFETSCAILHVQTMRRMRKLRMFRPHGCASWAERMKPAGWCTQYLKRYRWAFSGSGRSSSVLKDWPSRDGGMQSTTSGNATRRTSEPNWGFKQSLNCTWMTLQLQMRRHYFESLWRLLTSSHKHWKNRKGVLDQYVVIWG